MKALVLKTSDMAKRWTQRPDRHHCFHAPKSAIRKLPESVCQTCLILVGKTVQHKLKACSLNSGFVNGLGAHNLLEDGISLNFLGT